MAQAQEPNNPLFAVRVNGADLPAGARTLINSVTVEESLDRAGACALELSDWDMNTQRVKWADDALFDPGATI
jgi:hypothetical protein